MADTYPHGLISWTDLSVPDVESAKAFYTALMGWEVEDLYVGGRRVYTMFHKDGKKAAGLGQQSVDVQRRGIPPMWTTYINVDDVAAVARAFGEHGGHLIVTPMDVQDSGRMAYGLDPVGAPVGFWQPGTHRGADAFNDPGFMTWNELTTRRVDDAVAFWERVLPWKIHAQDYGQGFLYRVITVGDRPTGGILRIDETSPSGLPSHWMVYFRVHDADAAAAHVTELGGSVVVPGFDTTQGRVAVINDPQGGNVSIIGPPPPTDR